MKQTIEFYYNLKIKELFIDNELYYFYLNNDKYYFIFFQRTEKDLKDIIECNNELMSLNIPVHEIIMNNKNEYLTYIEESPYILIKVNYKNEEVSLLDINNYNNKLFLKQNNTLYRNDWVNLWSKKVDYIEQQLKEIKIDKVIHNSIDYYIGLSENAIYYVNAVNQKYKNNNDYKIVLSRKRIIYPNMSINYFNPLYFIFDIETRDIAEYIKSMFFKGEDPFFELQNYLKVAHLSFYSANMLFARLLFPSYYFDLYEKIVNKDESSQILLDVIKKNKDYEEFLKKAYKEISLYAPLEDISYLIE